jgi:hypothetical protein
MRDSFTLISSETGSSSMRVHIVMTNESLVICREIGSSQFILLYPAIPIKDIAVNAQSLDREIVGEYILLFSIQGGKKNIVVRADSKEVRNLWVGVDPEAPSTAALASRSLTSNPSLKNAPAAIAPPAPKPSKSSSSIRNTEIFDFYTEEISPIESDDDDLYYNTKGSNNNNNGGSKPRDTIMDIYDNQLHEFEEDMDDFPPIPVHKDANEELANITPQSIKILPQVPNLPNAQSSTDGGASQPPSQAQAPSKDNVKMTYIAPPTAQMAKLSTSPVMPTNQSASSMNSSPPSPQTPLSGRPLGPGMKNESKPSSPRAVEVQQAIIPEVMQAVTQTTDEYLKNQQSNGQNVLPRTSSMRNNPNKNAPTSPIVAQRPSAPPPAPQHQMGPPQGQFAPPNGGVNQFGNMRPMPPQQNFRPGPPPGSPQQPLNRMMSNNAPPRPMMNGPRPPMNPSLSSGRAGPPAPIMMAPSFSNGTNNGGMRRPPPGQPLSPRIQSNPHLQPGNPNDLNSPPLSVSLTLHFMFYFLIINLFRHS